MNTLLVIFLIFVAVVVISKIGERNGWSGCAQWALLIPVAILIALIV